MAFAFALFQASALVKLDEKLGTGYGGAVVEGGKVYLLDRVNDQQDVLRCIDLATGKELRRFATGAGPDGIAVAIRR